jgi:hypothetical protein
MGTANDVRKPFVKIVRIGDEFWSDTNAVVEFHPARLLALDPPKRCC